MYVVKFGSQATYLESKILLIPNLLSSFGLNFGKWIEKTGFRVFNIIIMIAKHFVPAI